MEDERDFIMYMQVLKQHNVSGKFQFNIS